MKGMVYLLLTGTAVFWGANFNVGKAALARMEPMSMVAWRFLLAALCMVGILWVRERPSLRTLRPYLLYYVLLGLLGVFGMNALLFIGLTWTSPINASLIMAANPLLTALLSLALLGERLRPRQLAGLAISLIGVLFVVTGGSFAKLFAVSPGDLLVLGGNLCWALYGVLSRKYLQGSSPLATSALTMLFGALFMVPFAAGKPVVMTGPGAGQVWLAIGFMAFFGSVLAYLWWNRGMKELGPNRTAIFFNLVPVSTMVITLLTGGSIRTGQWLGAALVLGGVLLASRQAKRPVGGRLPVSSKTA